MDGYIYFSSPLNLKQKSTILSAGGTLGGVEFTAYKCVLVNSEDVIIYIDDNSTVTYNGNTYRGTAYYLLGKGSIR